MQLPPPPTPPLQFRVQQSVGTEAGVPAALQLAMTEAQVEVVGLHTPEQHSLPPWQGASTFAQETTAPPPVPPVLMAPPVPRAPPLAAPPSSPPAPAAASMPPSSVPPAPPEAAPSIAPVSPPPPSPP